MATVKKFGHLLVEKQIRHNERNNQNYSNKEIDPKRKHLNYSLSPERDMPTYDYYLKRKSELYVFNRQDVNTMAGWVLTVPQDIETPEEEKIFFKAAYDFLENKYGKKNVVQAVVHYDEGLTEQVKNRWGVYKKDKNGNIEKTVTYGRAHLHFNFIPVVKDNNLKHIQTEKICAYNVLTPTKLKMFHHELDIYLKKHGIKGEVNTGITKANGRNYSVEELKRITKLEKEIQIMQEKIKKYEHRYEITL